MAISRSQIPEQIDSFATGGDPSLDSLQSLTPDPITMQQIEDESKKLSFLFPNQSRQTIYDLASSLAKGLSAQAQSGTAPSISYGLALGFDLFNENSNKLKSANADLQQQLNLFAYQQLEKKREEQREINKLAIDQSFKIQLEEMKNSGQLFGGTSESAGAWNYILSKIDTKTNTFKNIPDGEGGSKPYDPSADPYYAVAKAVLERPKREIKNEPGKGQVQIETPGFDVDSVLGVKKPIAPQSAIDDLRKDPKLYDQFVNYYGIEQVPPELRQ